VSVDRPDASSDPASALDLAAASERVERADTQAMLDALAVRLEQALPRAVSVKRRRVGGFRSKRTEVERIAVELTDQRFELNQGAAGIACARAKVVRGITLKRDELPMQEWISELVGEVTRSATLSEQARVALEGLVSCAPCSAAAAAAGARRPTRSARRSRRAGTLNRWRASSRDGSRSRPPSGSRCWRRPRARRPSRAISASPSSRCSTASAWRR
jgi:hypothetical protein